MSAMTMSFDAVDAAQLENLTQGQIIDFVVIPDGRSFRVDEIAVTDNAFGSGPPRFEQVANVGDTAPCFELTDQDGNSVSLASLSGRLVLLDFIYTNCPGPCPILTSRNVTLQLSLADDLRARTHFVSISIDPERDTPQALRSYAEARGANLSGWSFLTGTPRSIEVVLGGYGVGTVPSENGEIDHVVATFLIDSEGRIAHRYLGLEHGADELLADLEELASR